MATITPMPSYLTGSVCPDCGRALRTAARFCNGCGTPVATVPVQRVGRRTVGASLAAHPAGKGAAGQGGGTVISGQSVTYATPALQTPSTQLPGAATSNLAAAARVMGHGALTKAGAIGSRVAVQARRTAPTAQRLIHPAEDAPPTLPAKALAGQGVQRVRALGRSTRGAVTRVRSPRADRVRSTRTAWLLWLLLGWLGAHRFYAGSMRLGARRLLVTLGCWVGAVATVSTTVSAVRGTLMTAGPDLIALLLSGRIPEALAFPAEVVDHISTTSQIGAIAMVALLTVPLILWLADIVWLSIRLRDN